MADHPTVERLAAAAAGCQACELYRDATQTVFGEGPAAARVVLVGEQPGDQEDVAGEPFVGPAGRLLDEALEATGIDRRQVYVTNAVKHFRWEARGTRRLHKRPGVEHVRACAPWLEAELAVVRPQVVVGLGATAAQALLGR
ncbi:MAG: UdgX family uracil-DNA binding protein, partial [Acidimicrobiales bacterium]